MAESRALPSGSERTVAVVGVGLIGGSIAAALKKRRPDMRVTGVGRSRERLAAAERAGLIDSGTTDLSEAAAEADLIVFCTPVDLIVAGVREAAAHCRPGTLITDAGSVKQSICRALDSALPAGVAFIGSHPLAGSEKNGFQHAEADLFENRVCVVTPLPTVNRDELARLAGFWQLLGMTVLEMTPEEHDRALAQTSHLPHVVAAALASLLSEPNRPLAATGFADTTRIAAGDSRLWVGILLDNREQVVKGIDEYNSTLAQFRQAIADRDAARLKKLLENAKRKRDELGGD